MCFQSHADVKLSVNPSSFVQSDDHIAKNNIRPEQTVEATSKTQKAILERVNGNRSIPSNIEVDSQYFKYTESTSTGDRIIKLHSVKLDPLEPAKFRHKKVPRSSQKLPVPILYCPPCETNAGHVTDWNIPPSISNWKNPKGYSIPLDKRLAADGRNLHEHQINDNFANLSEALYLAEKKARDAIQVRGQIRKELHLKEKEAKEDELRKLAMNAKKRRISEEETAAVK